VTGSGGDRPGADGVKRPWRRWSKKALEMSGETLVVAGRHRARQRQQVVLTRSKCGLHP